MYTMIHLQLLLCKGSSSTAGMLKRFADRPRPVILKILPIMLLSSAQKIAHYAQYYARKY